MEAWNIVKIEDSHIHTASIVLVRCFIQWSIHYNGPKLPNVATIKRQLQQHNTACNKKNTPAPTKVCVQQYKCLCNNYKKEPATAKTIIYITCSTIFTWSSKLLAGVLLLATIICVPTVGRGGIPQGYHGVCKVLCNRQ